MKQELVRINSSDNIEQVGILYNPNTETKRIVIHVHGLAGNFYENRFLDILAKTYTENGLAFLTFNNRGNGYVTDLLKGNDFTVIGACFERFKDCLLDIEGVINWVKEKGYSEIILEGHSYGCNKVLYYYHHKKDDSIKKIVLLAPCDTAGESKKFLSEEEYNRALSESTRLVNENRADELIDFSVMTNGKVTAGTYYYGFIPGSDVDFIRYSDGENGESDILKNVSVPTSVIFGDEDECVLTESIEVVKKYLINNIKNCTLKVIPGANHLYANKYKELGEAIKEIVI